MAFATILAVVAGLTITASASFAHDIYASVIKGHNVSEAEQVRVSRITAVVLGVIAIGLGILANGQNVAFLVALAFAVAAAATGPTSPGSRSPIRASCRFHWPSCWASSGHSPPATRAIPG
ncbi:SSS sodium solute transporter [Mycobacteroides abscessus subsp. massiliense]|nr:SSS sodium solute transporter [Mycobacteroides abscessus subsp. massiliense]